MASQTYALTGKKRPTAYLDILNAEVPTLATKKSIADEKVYRDKTLALEAQRQEDHRRISAEELDHAKKAAKTSTLVGLGQMGAAAHFGAKRDKQLLDTINSGGKSKGGNPGTALTGGGTGGAAPTTEAPEFLSKEGAGDVSNWKEGAKNWGDLAAGLGASVIGAELGDQLGIGRTAGGAAAGGLVSYLSSGDPYTATINAVLGGVLGGIF